MATESTDISVYSHTDGAHIIVDNFDDLVSIAVFCHRAHISVYIEQAAAQRLIDALTATLARLQAQPETQEA